MCNKTVILLMALIGLGLSSVGLAAPPALTEAQRMQLETAGDRVDRLDEAALYPLLENADQWQPGDAAGAQIPDYDALLQSPAEHRGELFFIEGVLGRSIEVGQMARPGPWGEDLVQWAVLVREQPTEEVAIVYLTDPPTPNPFVGARVRLPARFYKVWRTEDINNNDTDFLVFVGHGAQVLGRESGGANPLIGGLLIVFVLAAFFYFIRKRVAAQRSVTRPGAHGVDAHHLHERDEPAEADEQAQGSPLPEDPADALGELERRHQHPGQGAAQPGGDEASDRP